MITNSEDIPVEPPQSGKDDSSLNDHLWIPEPESQERVVATPQASGSSSLLRDRLYIGNLHSTVDEYSLLQVFTKFGKVSKLDFLFHKAGPNKGKPRGYAFIEYLHEGDARTALESINGKLLRGRKLVVTFAHQAPLEQPGGIRQAGRVKRTDARPTTLSMMKSGIHTRPEGTDNKIAMMEAKLRQMKSSTTSSANSLPLKPPAPGSLLGLASKQCHGGKGTFSRNPSGLTIPRSNTHAEPPSHPKPSVEADPAPSRSSATLHTRPEVVKSSISCKRVIPGVKIVKERNK